MARYNFFDFPHKPFRFMWLELVQHIGNANYTSDEALRKLKEEVDFAANTYIHHGNDESEWFGARLAELAPEMARDWIAEHDSQEAELREFPVRAQALLDEPDHAKRAEMARDFYIFASKFVAEELHHMMKEQEKVMVPFQEAYTDEQLMELEQQFLRDRISPEYMQSLTPLFLRSGNIDERHFTLSIIQSQIPADAFAGMLDDFAAQFVPADELAVIKQRLGVA
jgi:hypothetical protein